MMTVKQTKKPKTTAGFSNKLAKLGSVQLFYVSLGLLVLAVLTLSAAVSVEHRYNHERTVPTAFAGYGVGTTVRMGSASMQIVKVSVSNGMPGFAAPKGLHYLIIDFVVRNDSEHPINVLPSSDTYLKDAAGDVAYLTPFNLQNPFHAGAVLPGDQVKGQLSYIGHTTGSLRLYVDSIWSGGVVPFKVQ